MFGSLGMRGRLVAASGVVLVLGILIVAGFGVWRAHAELERQGLEAVELYFKVTDDALRQKGQGYRAVDGKLLIGDYVISGNYEVPDRVKAATKATVSIFIGDTRTSTTVVKPGTTERAVGTKFNAGDAIYDIIYRKGESYRGYAMVLNTNYILGYNPIKDASGRVIGSMAVGIPASEFLENIEHVGFQQLAFTLVALAIGVAALMMFIARETNRLDELRGRIKAVEEGDVSSPVPHAERRDEIGGLAKAVASFRDAAREQIQRREAERRAAAEELAKQRKLNDMVASFTDDMAVIAETIASSAKQMRGSAESLNGAAGAAQRDSDAIAATAEEASSNVGSVASATEELSTSIRDIARQMNQAARVASQGVDEAASTNETVQGLAEAASRIGDVVRLINEIAGQTNLLALNATIEAARAGEAGKGFAVVAAEVKNLAGQTAKATEEIQSQIGAIQEETRRAVEAISKITGTIGQINEIAVTVATAVEQQGAATGEIARNVAQASNGAQQVAAQVVGVARTATEVGGAAVQLRSVADDLGRKAEGLRESVGGFVSRLRA